MRWQWLGGLLLLMAATLAHAQEAAPKLAPGFTALPKDAKVVIAPLDVELYSLSAGGQPEPRADWTEAAKRHIRAALHDKARSLQLAWSEMDPKTADEHAELMHLHDAVADAVTMHHGRFARLPTKDGKLEWSFGEALRPLQQATGARYALFTYVRDSYATPQRKAMIGAVALLAAATSGSLVLLNGGLQTGYASLVDLETGQVLWFNGIDASQGDLREPQAAAESVKVLLTGFPGVQ